MYKIIEEKDFQAAESGFINFPDFMYKYIKENLKNDYPHFTSTKLQPQFKYYFKDKNAYLFKVNLKLFLSDSYNSLYWIHYDGKNFYCVWYRTNGGAAVEDSEYIKSSDEDLIIYLNSMGNMGNIIGGQQKYIEYKNLQTALLREQKINQILNEL